MLMNQVFEALDHAIDNGYDLDKEPAQAMADDLGEYDADLVDVPVKDLLPHVRAWKVSRLPTR